jgi:hypothetical protein
MPGLGTLHAGAPHIAVRYTDTRSGAKITFTTSDATLVSAIHDWFAAQVSDHGSHARRMNN